MHVGFLIVAVALATTVEMVEALTIVLAVGITRGWRSTFEGAGVGLLALAVIVAVLGPALVKYVPIDVLRLVIGTLLLIFGMQWLRKAILRASGNKALHDEAAIFKNQVATLTQMASDFKPGRDAVAFTVSFKGVFLEGLEVVMIVISFGVPAGHLGIASIAAAGTAGVVGLAGAAVAKPLARVPENAMKMGVGLLLTAFGTFWVGEGMGVPWPDADLSILGILAALAAITFALTVALKRRTSLSLEEAA